MDDLIDETPDNNVLRELQSRVNALETQLQALSAVPNVTVIRAPVEVKLKEPDVFNGTTDIRFWALDMENNIRERRVPEESQVSYVVSYLAPSIKQRAQRLQLDNDDHVSCWPVLKVWLKDNYGLANPEATAEANLDELVMRSGQTVLGFITEFEYTVADLKWNGAALCSAFRQRLHPRIMEKVNQDFFKPWPANLTAWKKAAQQAKSQIRMTQQLTQPKPTKGPSPFKD